MVYRHKGGFGCPHYDKNDLDVLKFDYERIFNEIIRRTNSVTRLGA